MVDRLRVTELDFDSIKTNLKSFLQQQDTFSDYDFDGSGLSVLLDILAYNTHYNAYYLNMVANESFMDTAVLRDSVVSLAKTLGYTPYSIKAPTATINFTANSDSSSTGTLTVPRGFSFLSEQIDNKSYNFVVLEDTLVTKSNSQYVFSNLDISEGQFVSYNFSHSATSNPKQVFTLPDSNIDTTTIKVSVIPNVSNTATSTYSKVSDVLDVGPTSEVYFLQEGKNGQFQIYFGNDSVGKKLNDGATIAVSYLVTNGQSANKANNFVSSGTLVDSLNEILDDQLINSVSSASGGASRETVDSIKFSAPNQFTTQNRLVTKKDYETFIVKELPSIEAISIWGGEDNVPIVYGKVFVSLKPKANFFISETEKSRIIDDVLKPKGIIGVNVEIVDPDFTYLLVTNVVKYDPRKTTLTAEALKDAIRNSILSFNSNFLNTFDSTFTESKFSEAIDDTETNAIIGSQVDVRLQKRITPVIGTSSYEIKFNEELKRGTSSDRLVSTKFSGFDNTGTPREVEFEEVPQSSTGISRINIDDPGYGYSVAPTLTITGDGKGAKAEAVIAGGEIKSVNIIDRGVDYTSATITLTGGDGIGCKLSVAVDAKNGTIRTIFFDEDGNRQIINDNAGDIDYENGIIEINTIRITSVPSSADVDGLIRFTIGSETGVIESTRNNIIAIDPEDATSISTTLESVTS